MAEKRYEVGSGKVFVFGSNRAGIHSAGAALYARKWLGALQLVGEGPMPLQDEPSCYALPTKDEHIKTLPLLEIEKHVNRFLAFARRRPDLQFFVTRVGCGLAGYKDEDIKHMFAEAPANCELPEGWRLDWVCSQCGDSGYGFHACQAFLDYGDDRSDA